MTDLLAHAERILRHSQRFYLRLCACCDRPVGQGGATCDHSRELLAQGGAWLRELHDHPRLPWNSHAGPWSLPIIAEVGLAWPESSVTRLGRAG